MSNGEYNIEAIRHPTYVWAVVEGYAERTARLRPGGKAKQSLHTKTVCLRLRRKHDNPDFDPVHCTSQKLITTSFAVFAFRPLERHYSFSRLGIGAACLQRGCMPVIAQKPTNMIVAPPSYLYPWGQWRYISRRDKCKVVEFMEILRVAFYNIPPKYNGIPDDEPFMIAVLDWSWEPRVRSMDVCPPETLQSSLNGDLEDPTTAVYQRV
ncbi:hypothetical protein CPB85DRAFT_1253456 [Mucidula mucida]|nr:hypothetical protein CPB85DRAFT_1253456 [Mucidula mucida]